MKRKLLLLLMLLYCGLLFISCGEIAYDSSDRITFEGYVKRQDGTPLKDIAVSTHVYLDGTYGDSDKISYTKTDADGHYLMIFPKPTNHTNISLILNGNDYYEPVPDLMNTLTSYSISNILPEDLTSLHFDFGSTALYSEAEITTLTINFITDGTESNGYFPITGYEGLFPYMQMFYNQPDYEVDPNYLLYTANWPEPIGLNQYYYVLQDDGITYSRTFTVLKNQAFILKYRDAGNEVTSVNIPIANQPVNYSINY